MGCPRYYFGVVITVSQMTQPMDRSDASHILQKELQASSRIYNARLDLETFPRLPEKLSSEMLEKKVALAKDILKTEVLDPLLLEGIVLDDGDGFARRTQGSSITVAEMDELLDRGVVGPGTTGGFVAKTPYNGDYPQLTGINPDLDRSHLYEYVGQSDVKFSRAVPLVSGGFSACHAVILYDHTARQMALAHVMRHDWDPGHIEAINETWPHSGKRDLIYVYGSGSRTDHDEAMAKAVGATTVYTLHVATGACHWGVVLDPVTNELSVVRKTPKDVVTYKAFSHEAVHPLHKDPEIVGLGREERILCAVDQSMRDPSWGRANVLFGETQLKKLAGLVNQLTDEKFSGRTIGDYLTERGLATSIETARGSLLIPAGFGDSEPDQENRMTEIYKRLKPHGVATFLRGNDVVNLQRRLTVAFASELNLYDRYASVFRRDSEEVAVTTSAKELKFRIAGDPGGSLYSDLLGKAGELQAQQGYKLLFDSGFGSARSDTIVPPDPRIIEYRKKLKAMGFD